MKMIMSVLLLNTHYIQAKATIFDKKMLSDVISEHVFFKIFLGGMPPDPPSKSMLRILGVLCTLAIYIASLTQT